MRQWGVEGCVWLFSRFRQNGKSLCTFFTGKQGGSFAGFMTVSKKEWTDTRGRVVLVIRCFLKHKTNFTTVGIFWDLELRSSLTLSPRRRPGINNKTPSLSFFSSAQAQGSPKDPRARLLPSSPEPFEMVWNPGSSQSATSSSQLPGG